MKCRGAICELNVDLTRRPAAIPLAPTAARHQGEKAEISDTFKSKGGFNIPPAKPHQLPTLGTALANSICYSQPENFTGRFVGPADHNTDPDLEQMIVSIWQAEGGGPAV